MAYEKQTWEDYPSTNTPITSDRLNHIEQGIYDNSTDIVSTATQLRNEMKTNIVTGQEVATNEYVDGKQIFRKRVDVGNLPGASAKKLVSIGLTNVNIINFSGYYFSSYEGFGIPINHATGTNYYVQTYLVLNTMKIDISCGSDRSSYTGYVDIYYTKN